MQVEDSSPSAPQDVSGEAIQEGPTEGTDTAQEHAHIIRTRQGDVLLRNTILKSDHFPGCQNKDLVPLLNGAPNFRKVEGVPVFGVAVPTVDGLRVVLDQMKQQLDEGTVVYWNNMREEPLIYINGKPFVVREKDNPFANLEYTGIDARRLESMEERLKADVLAEAEQYECQILVSDEDDDFTVFDAMVAVSPQDVQTPKEVFEELSRDGYRVEYQRIPITDEKAPKELDFDTLVNLVWDMPPDSALMFNCQMGRGRTTTGMIIATLIRLRRNQVFPRGGSENGSDAVDAPPWYCSGVDRSLASQQGAAMLKKKDSAGVLKAGHFLVVRSMLRLLQHGSPAKATLDAVIDACSAMQNLRTAIATYRGRLMKEPKESKRSALLHVCQEYIERYCVLIAFVSYLHSSSFDPGSHKHQTYSQWMSARPELQSVWHRLLRTFPLMSLELDEESGQDKLLDDNQMAIRQRGFEDIHAALAQRSGSVLSACTILKSETYPSLYSDKITQLIPGAPNFRQVSTYPVYGVGISTVAGITAILSQVGAAPDTATDSQRTAVWHNLREEPVLYVNGKPYVLREAAGPYKNMKEYTGIRAKRLEQMERRLKDEVWDEAARLKGRVLVLYETAGANNDKAKGHLEHGHEMILSKDAIQTPLEVYTSLAEQGHRIAYRRIAMTDGMCPDHTDVDELHRSISTADKGTSSFIFNCQQGKGRTTICMVLALLHTTRHERPAVYEPSRNPVTTIPVSCSPTIDPISQNTPMKQLSLADSTGGVSSQESDSDDDHCSQPSSPDTARHAPPSTPPRTTTNGSTSTAPQPTDDSAITQLSTPKRDTHSPPPSCVRATPDTRDPSTASRKRPCLASSLSRAPASYSRMSHHHLCEPKALDTKPAPAPVPMEQMLQEEESAKNDLVIAMRRGMYIGVRRLLRQLVDADCTARWVDTIVDKCSHMIHLRTVIARYRLPRRKVSQWQPEMSKLELAFTRGSVALARYCLLIAYGCYLTHAKGDIAFSDWIRSMPSVQEALAAPLTNPMEALAPIPESSLRVDDKVVENELDYGNNGTVSNSTVSRVLSRRRFRMLTPHTILKSFHSPDAFGGDLAGCLDGVSDLRKSPEFPIWITSSPSVQGLRSLLDQLGAKREGGPNVVIIDVREELSAYVCGHPYIRRELEIPAASMHHAGIHWRQLESLERWLLDDIKTDCRQWSHRFLLHREIARPPTKSVIDSGESVTPPALDTDCTTHVSQGIEFTAYWESVDATDPINVDTGLATARQVATQLQKEGYRAHYRRVPLSRQRTPVAHDLTDLHESISTIRSTADTRYLIIARTANSTSALYVCTFLATALQAVLSIVDAPASSDSTGERPSDTPRRSLLTDSPRVSPQSGGGVLDTLAVMNICRALPMGIIWKGEVDSAMQQCEEMGSMADDIKACAEKVRALQPETEKKNEVNFMLERSAARRLGAHYLMRYSLLIMFRSYYQTVMEAELSPEAKPCPAFHLWFDERKELQHLLTTLVLD